MITEIAKSLYARTDSLKNFTSMKLLFAKNRGIMRIELQSIEKQVNELRDAIKENGSYSDEYLELIDNMLRMIEIMDLNLDINFRKSRKETVKFASALPILSRPFFTADDPLKISPDEAFMLNIRACL